MRFVDFLKATVMLSGAGATALAILTVISATNDQDDKVVLYMAAWWIAATLIGSWIGRRKGPSTPIADLLANSSTATMMPEISPASVLLNRLWPLLVAVLISAGLSFLAPQIPGIATGFAIIWSLAWRHQDKAVTAIEERDGVVFFVQKTAFYKPMTLERMPGFKREVPT
jgi:hypothetical protein